MDRVTAPLRHLAHRRCSGIIRLCRYKSISKSKGVNPVEASLNAETTSKEIKRKEIVKNSWVVGGNYPVWEDMKTVYGDLLVGKQQRKKYVKKYKEPITHHGYVVESEEEKRRESTGAGRNRITSFDVVTAAYGPVLDLDIKISPKNSSYNLESLKLEGIPETSEEAAARWNFMGNNAKHLIGKPSNEKNVTRKPAKAKVPKAVKVDPGMFDAHTESLYGPVVAATDIVVDYVNGRKAYSGPGIKRTDRYGKAYISPVPALQTSPDTITDEAKSLFGPVIREKRTPPRKVKIVQEESFDGPPEIPVLNEAESGTSWVGDNEDALIFGPVVRSLESSVMAEEKTGPYDRKPGDDFPSSSLFLAANTVNKKAARTVKNSLKEMPSSPETGGTMTWSSNQFSQEHVEIANLPTNGPTVGRDLSVDLNDYRIIQLKTEGDLKAVPQSPLMNKLRPNYISSSHELVLPGAIVMKICPEELLGKPLAPEKYPSVTAILDVTMPSASRERLDAWKRRKITELGVEGFQLFQRNIFSDGKGFHTAVETVLRGTKVNEVPVPKRNEGHWESLKGVFSDLSDVVGIEERVRHPFLCYKGVTDCVASLEGQPSVIEWKTSATKKETVDALYDNPIQVAAYLGAINFDENTRSKNLQIPNAAVVVAYSSGEPASVIRFDHNLISSYWTLWLKRLQQYWRLAAMQKSLPQRKFD